MKDRISDYWDEQRKEPTQWCNDRVELLVRLNIHGILDGFVFNKELPIIGVPTKTSAVITQIEGLLQTLTPSRGDS